jgi:hypothetical protein
LRPRGVRRVAAIAWSLRLASDNCRSFATCWS